MGESHARQARLSFRLSNELKEMIESAATVSGQSVSNYVNGILVTYSQTVLKQSRATVLSNRDRETFVAILDDSNAKPNRPLTEAAERYKRRLE